MNRQECIEGISSQLAQLVNALLDASGQWEQEQWLATAEHETGAIATALGQMILQALVDRHGTGHGGPYHTDAQGQRRKFKEYRGRTIKTRLGDIRLRRAVYWSSSAVPTAIVPLDVTLGQDDELSPALQEAIAFTASQLTYEETVHLVKKLVGVDVSAGKVQTVTTQWGQRALQQRAQHLPAELPSERMAVVVDGTMVRTATRTRVAPPGRRQAFSEHWRETKLGALYSFDPQGRAHRDKRYTAHRQPARQGHVRPTSVGTDRSLQGPRSPRSGVDGRRCGMGLAIDRRASSPHRGDPRLPSRQESPLERGHRDVGKRQHASPAMDRATDRTAQGRPGGQDH